MLAIYSKIAKKMLRNGKVWFYPWDLSNPTPGMGETSMPRRLREGAVLGIFFRSADEKGRVAFRLSGKGLALAKK